MTLPTPPPPPVNVHLVMQDGTEIAVDTVYVGEKDGMHQWQVLQGPPLEQVRQLKIQELPPLTAVSLAAGYVGQ